MTVYANSYRHTCVVTYAYTYLYIYIGIYLYTHIGVKKIHIYILSTVHKSGSIHSCIRLCIHEDTQIHMYIDSIGVAKQVDRHMEMKCMYNISICQLRAGDGLISTRKAPSQNMYIHMYIYVHNALFICSAVM